MHWETRVTVVQKLFKYSTRIRRRIKSNRIRNPFLKEQEVNMSSAMCRKLAFGVVA